MNANKAHAAAANERTLVVPDDRLDDLAGRLAAL